ncbi:MAG TPA: methyltransferase domain-containing protein [Phycisphaerales bacterium]|nr:methyltransferase domain-containing protein [Phycisphaerales bacterium]
MTTRPKADDGRAAAGSAGQPPRGALTFWLEFFRAPTVLGNCFESTAPLARAILEGLPLEEAGAVVELGAGTGPVTEHLLPRLGAGARFLAVELNPTLAAAFRARFPRVALAEADAGELPRLGAAAGLEPGTVDVIVSTLPFLLFDDATQSRVLGAAAAVLRPGGIFTTITNRPAWLMPSVRRFAERMARHVGPVAPVRPVWRAMPPAYIYRSVKPAD